LIKILFFAKDNLIVQPIYLDIADFLMKEHLLVFFRMQAQMVFSFYHELHVQCPYDSDIQYQK